MTYTKSKFTNNSSKVLLSSFWSCPLFQGSLHFWNSKKCHKGRIIQPLYVTLACACIVFAHFPAWEVFRSLVFWISFLQALLREQGLTVCWFCVCDNFSASVWSKRGDVPRRFQTSYEVARLLLMVPIELQQNSTPVFGAAVFCTTKIDNFRASLTLTSLTRLSAYWSKRRSLRWTFDGRWPLTDDDLGRKTTFDGRRPLTDDDLWRKTTFDERQPLNECELWRKMTFDGRRPLTDNHLWRKTTFA